MRAGAWLATLTHHEADVRFTVFGYEAVNPAWGFTDRTIDDHLLWLVTDGSCVGEIEGAPVVLERGSLLWMQPGARHTFAIGPAPAARRHPLTVYFVRFQLHHGGGRPSLDGAPAWQRDGAWDLVELMDALVDELRCRLPHRDVRLRALLSAVLAGELRRREADPVQSARTLDRAQRRAVEDYARDHLDDWPTPRDLAEHVRLSPDYFSRLFTQTFGVPPRTWLVEERVRRGAQLLSETLLSVTDIAATLRYDSVSSFSHQFRERMGVSPLAYRRSRP